MKLFPENAFDSLLHILFAVAFVAIAVVCVINTRPKYKQINGLMKTRCQFQESMKEKRREIQAVREMQRRFNEDREFVEALARENRRVFPGELVFVFEDK